MQAALSDPGPALLDVNVNPEEPPMPGKVNTEQAYKFAKSLARGQKDAAKILETIAEDQLREVI